MERLTNNKGELPKCNDCIEESNCYSDISCNHIFDALKKLAEYEDLEEQGLLPKLPCKVGDTVYVIEVSEEEFEHFHCGLRISKCEFDFWMIPLFGKCVFLTQAEAEEALQRMKRKDNQ